MPGSTVPVRVIGFVEPLSQHAFIDTNGARLELLELPPTSEPHRRPRAGVSAGQSDVRRIRSVGVYYSLVWDSRTRTE